MAAGDSNADASDGCETPPGHHETHTSDEAHCAEVTHWLEVRASVPLLLRRFATGMSQCASHETDIGMSTLQNQ